MGCLGCCYGMLGQTMSPDVTAVCDKAAVEGLKPMGDKAYGG